MNSKRKEEVQKVLLALLVSEKNPIRLTQLEQYYLEEEGEQIPWRSFGYVSLLNFLQSMPTFFEIRKLDGLYYVRGIASEKSKHVSSLVNRQKDSKKRISSRKLFRPSHYFPKTAPPRIHISADILSEIVLLIRESPNGLNKDYVLNIVNQRMPGVNVSMQELQTQLRELSHEVVMKDHLFLPVSSRMNNSNNSKLTETADVNVDKKATCLLPPKYCVSGTGESGSEDSMDEDDFSFVPSGYVPHGSTRNMRSLTIKKPICNFIQETVSKCQSQMDDPNVQHGDAKCEIQCNTESDEKVKTVDNQNKDFDPVNNESATMLINNRIKFRLRKLIEKYPNGIWCAELPEKYLEEYKISLNYIELGFNSVREFASHLPEIFRFVQPCNTGDFILYNAESAMPQGKKEERLKLTNLAELHQLCMLDEDVEILPTIVSSDTCKKLIPDGVMTLGESVGQISVVDLANNIKPYIEVFVVEVFTPSFFWIQLRKKQKIFDAFMKDLHNFYTLEYENYVIPPVVLEKGLNCACLYNGIWHRGLIKQVTPELQVTVMFYDYGTLKTYPAEDIYYLHRTFSYLPAQAIPCGLVNTKPCAGEKWSKNVTHQFALRTSQIPLVATIASIDGKNNSMMVTLTDTLEDEDVHINDWLVQQRLAVHGKMGDNVDMNNLMLYVEENLLFLPDRCYGADEVSDNASDINSLQNSMNVPLISPQSTLENNWLRPPPGLSLPVEQSRPPANAEKSLQHNFLSDFVKTANIPFLNTKRASTNPFLQDDTTSDSPSMTPRMFMELWNSNLQLQMQITSALNALLLNTATDTVNSDNLALATEQALKCEEHINSILRLFGGLNFDDNLSSTPKKSSNEASFADPWPKTANRQGAQTPVSNFHAYINESSTTSTSYAPTTSLFANGTTNDSPPYADAILNGQSCPVPIPNGTTNIIFINDTMKADPVFSTSFRPVSAFHPNASAADTVYSNSEGVNEFNFNSVHRNPATPRCKEYGTKMKPLFAEDKPRIDEINCIASPLVTEGNTLNLNYYNEFADIWLQKGAPVRKETNPFKLSMSSEETPLAMSPVKRSAEQTAKQAVQKSIKDYFDGEPFLTGREHELSKTDVISRIFDQAPPVTYNITETEEGRTQDPQKYHEVSLPRREQTIDWNVSKFTVKELNTDVNNLIPTNRPFDTLDRNYSVNEGRAINAPALLADNPNLDDEGYLTRPSTSHTSESSPPLFSMQAINETKYNENLPVDAFNETPTPSAEAWMKSVENTVKSWKKEEAGLSQNKLVGENFVTCQQPAVSMNQQFTYDRDLISLKNITTDYSENTGALGAAKVEASSPADGEDQKFALKASALTEEQSSNYKSFQLSSVPVENYLFFHAIELTNRVVYVFHYCCEGWMSTDEFVKAFTEFKTSSYMISLLGILNVNVPFKELRRSEHPLEFAQLDGTPITVTRDGNKKINKLHLLPLTSALKMLRKLRIVSREDVDNAVVKKEFVHGSIIHEIWTLINAYGRLRHLVDEELSQK